MKTNEPDEMDSVRGLLDGERVAAYLGIPRGTIRSWEKRKNDNIPGVHTKFPNPIPERLGGTALWDAKDIRAFKPSLDEARLRKSIKKEKDPSPGATDVLHADTVGP
jgi:predicted DNA-binding transcriptional regulator AlpA